MTAPHIVRHPTGKVRKTAAAPSAEFAPGFFTELIRAHNWPPRFEPQCSLVSDAEIRQRATDARMRIVAEGREHFGDLGARNSNRLRGDAAAQKVRVG